MADGMKTKVWAYDPITQSRVQVVKNLTKQCNICGGTGDAHKMGDEGLQSCPVCDGLGLIALDEPLERIEVSVRGVIKGFKKLSQSMEEAKANLILLSEMAINVSGEVRAHLDINNAKTSKK